MGQILKGTISLGVLLFFMACSNSSTNNNNQSQQGEQNNVQNLNAMSKSKLNCQRPLNVWIQTANYVSKGNYMLTYSWNSVVNATGYEFDFLINGTSSFQNPIVSDTFITFPQAISATDSINVRVRTICGTEKSTSAKESSKIVYLNAVETDAPVFFVEPTTTITDICSENCDKLKFNSLNFLNSNGAAITLDNFAMLVYYYDFQTVKDCIPCGTGGSTPVVDPVLFNNCLNDPLNEYWLFDPGAYQVCP